jgi:hypothetical protein
MSAGRSTPAAPPAKVCSFSLLPASPPTQNPLGAGNPLVLGSEWFCRIAGKLEPFLWIPWRDSRKGRWDFPQTRQEIKGNSFQGETGRLEPEGGLHSSGHVLKYSHQAHPAALHNKPGSLGQDRFFQRGKIGKIGNLGPLPQQKIPGQAESLLSREDLGGPSISKNPRWASLHTTNMPAGQGENLLVPENTSEWPPFLTRLLTKRVPF